MFCKQLSSNASQANGAIFTQAVSSEDLEGPFSVSVVIFFANISTKLGAITSAWFDLILSMSHARQISAG